MGRSWNSAGDRFTLSNGSLEPISRAARALNSGRTRHESDLPQPDEHQQQQNQTWIATGSVEDGVNMGQNDGHASQEAEAWGQWQALLWLMNLGFTQVVIELHLA